MTATLPLPVPRFPQHFSASDAAALPPQMDATNWGDRCCGIACLRSLLAFYQLPVPSAAALLLEGLERGAWSSKGWIHTGLVDLARQHNLTGVAAGVDDCVALRRLTLTGTPVLVSCTHQFPQDGRRGGHLVIVTGVRHRRDDQVVDFVYPSRWGSANHCVAAERFGASFTGRVVVLRPMPA